MTKLQASWLIKQQHSIYQTVPYLHYYYYYYLVFWRASLCLSSSLGAAVSPVSAPFHHVASAESRSEHHELTLERVGLEADASLSINEVNFRLKMSRTIIISSFLRQSRQKVHWDFCSKKQSDFNQPNVEYLDCVRKPQHRQREAMLTQGEHAKCTLKDP